MNKLNIHNFWRSNIFIILLFAIVSVISGLLMYRSHFIEITFDIGFHWQRIYEIHDSITHGYFPTMISENYFSKSGSAVMSMYPQFNLLPMVILTFIFKSLINLYNVSFIIIVFFDLLISYFSSLGYNKNKRISFIFSISYVVNTRLLFYYCGVAYSIGTVTSISFLPFVLFGFLSLLDKNKWVELSFGLSAILLSHVISFGASIMLVFILFIVNIHEFKDRKKIFALFKSAITTLMLTSIFWIPFVLISIKNNLNIPRIDYIAGDSSSTIFSILDNKVTSSITLIALIGLILCIVYYRRLNPKLRQLFWTSIAFIIISSSLFPWHIAGSTFLIHLQFPYRLNIIPQLLLCYLFAEIFYLIIREQKNSFVIIALVSLATLCLQMDAQKETVGNFSNRPESVGQNIGGFYTVARSDKEFRNIINMKASSTDYYPQSSLNSVNNIIDSVAVYDKGNKLPVDSMGNGKFSFKISKNISKLTLPFLYYNGIDYQVKLDGNTVKGYSNKNSMMTIDNVDKGEHFVQIIVHKTKAEMISYVFFFIGLVILLSEAFNVLLKKIKLNKGK
ncbi:hypothetical protein [Apilactobacillus kunkeei]|uniref:hypothetical protein n=1 Tax=Apilactobacillus kunkeei TaxID=148814 RepID=UPI004033391E